MDLDAIPLWRGEGREQVTLKQLADDYAQYVYLSRFSNSNVFLEAVRDGVGRLRRRRRSLTRILGMQTRSATWASGLAS
jgi:hypothetical protein